MLNPTTLTTPQITLKKMTGNSLGSILLKRRLLTHGQLDHALQKQRQQARIMGWKLLGEILLEDEIISRRDLEDALLRQVKLNEMEYPEIYH